MDITGPLHAAIFAALTADSPPSVAGGRVYDDGNVPATPVFPYVVLGLFLATDAGDKGTDTDSGHADDFSQTIDIWGRGDRGKKQVEEVMAAIYALLHGQTLVLAGSPTPGHVATCRVTFKQIAPDPDVLTMHGIMRIEGYCNAT